VFIEDLAPISTEEMPPSDFFFSNKRRDIVKRETHQRDGFIVKRHRVLYDGQSLDEVDFVMEMAGSLGGFCHDESMFNRESSGTTETKEFISETVAETNKHYGTECKK
jgi:hypothetical protein